MKWTSILAIYSLFWVLSAFLVMPFGIKTHDEAGIAKIHTIYTNDLDQGPYIAQTLKTDDTPDQTDRSSRSSPPSTLGISPVGGSVQCCSSGDADRPVENPLASLACDFRRLLSHGERSGSRGRPCRPRRPAENILRRASVRMSISGRNRHRRVRRSLVASISRVAGFSPPLSGWGSRARVPIAARRSAAV